MKKDFYVHESSYVDEGAIIGSDSKVWHFSHVMSTAKIGKNCVIGQNVFIGSNVQIGNSVKVQNNVSIYDGVICEDEVFVGPSVVFTNVINPRSFVDRKMKFKKTYLSIGCTIGANSTIVCGNVIGKYSFVGAGSVVTKDIGDYALVLGNPAIQIGWVSKAGNRLEFDNNGIARCSEGDEEYILQQGQVTLKI